MGRFDLLTQLDKKPLPSKPSPSLVEPLKPSLLPDNGIVIPRHHDTMIPSTHDTVIPESEEEMIEAVRKAVKQLGKEPATQRLTLEEKQALAEIEYTYKQQGMKTSGNEIIRIALNYVVRDYRKNKEQSILVKVLQKLNS